MGFLEEEIRRIERGPRLWRWILPLLALLGVVLILVLALFAGSWFLSYTKEGSIAVIRLEGPLATGDYSGPDGTGSEFAGAEIRGAADNPLVEAIVLRVNSPGGSPAAAQEITADVEYAKARKPVVVSMGDMATSAAYAISAHADRIFANPDTITGGIGTVWVFTDVSRWLEIEGYNVTVVKSGEKKDMASPYRPLTADEQAYAQVLVNESFERFMEDILGERNVSRSEIEDGRVVRGEEAVRIGLVDRLGNIHDAIGEARILAGSRVSSSAEDQPS